jgi:hypothetical protein
LFGVGVASAEDAAEVDCEGRNPLYCGAAAPVRDVNGVITTPPGGCEGRNPAYCQEVAPEAKADVPPRSRRRRVRSDSSNPNLNPGRNPNQNPTQNPVQNPNRRGSSSDPAT